MKEKRREQNKSDLDPSRFAQMRSRGCLSFSIIRDVPANAWLGISMSSIRWRSPNFFSKHQNQYPNNCTCHLFQPERHWNITNNLTSNSIWHVTRCWPIRYLGFVYPEISHACRSLLVRRKATQKRIDESKCNVWPPSTKGRAVGNLDFAYISTPARRHWRRWRVWWISQDGASHLPRT